MGRLQNRQIDPALERVLDEVDEVFRKHGVGGSIVVHSKQTAAFRITFAEWSGIQIGDQDENGGAPVRIRLSSNDRETSEGSVHGIQAIRDLSRVVFQRMSAFVDHMLAIIQAEGVQVDMHPVTEDPDVNAH